MITIFCFSENLLVAAANRFKVLKIFISLKLQSIYRTVDYSLRKPQMPRVSNGNLIVMKWQNIHMISNICFKQRKREKERETHTQREQNLAKQFTLHSAEGYSEPSPTSKQGGYLIGGNYFHKSIYLRCLKSF